MWIDRLASKKLRQLASTFPAVLVTGARQTGKTSLVRRQFPDYSYVSLDLPLLADQAEQSPESFLAAHPSPLIIDEVQYAPSLFRHLKVAIDQQRELRGQFILTGSQQFALMREVGDSLAGRCGLLNLPGLCIEEIRSSGWEPSAKSASKLLRRGGFPELWANPEIAAGDFFQAYVSTYLERDLRQLIRVGSLRDFERFVRACAARAGNLLNRSDLARDVGISHSTANEWLSALQAGNQVILLEPWFASLGKRLVKSPKLYFADTGLLCFLLGMDDLAIEASALTGRVWENLVLSELRTHLALEHPDWGLWFYRDQQNREADFLIQGPFDRVRLADAKWSETASPSAFAQLEKIARTLDASGDIRSVELALVTRSSHSARLDDNRRAVSAWRIADIAH
ncbi:MAG: ATP-binding protein [Gammaproteobacteria bacterium]|nr:ATP-binding protein [Gammaproteobacteria bacterium]